MLAFEHRTAFSGTIPIRILPCCVAGLTFRCTPDSVRGTARTLLAAVDVAGGHHNSPALNWVLPTRIRDILNCHTLHSGIAVACLVPRATGNRPAVGRLRPWVERGTWIHLGPSDLTTYRHTRRAQLFACRRGCNSSWLFYVSCHLPVRSDWIARVDPRFCLVYAACDYITPRTGYAARMAAPPYSAHTVDFPQRWITVPGFSRTCTSAPPVDAGSTRYAHTWSAHRTTVIALTLHTTALPRYWPATL